MNQITMLLSDDENKDYEQLKSRVEKKLGFSLTDANFVNYMIKKLEIFEDNEL